MILSRIVLLILISLLLGCSSTRKDNRIASERPRLFYVVSSGSIDLREYPELDAIISRHYDYEIKYLSGVFSRVLAEGKYDRGRRNPNWKRSVDYWKYLALRNSPGRLSSEDIGFIRKYGLRQTPAILVVYKNGQSQQFTKQMSSELLDDLFYQVRQKEIKMEQVNKMLDRFWNIQREDDRKDLAKWLENRILR